MLHSPCKDNKTVVLCTEEGEAMRQSVHSINCTCFFLSCTGQSFVIKNLSLCVLFRVHFKQVWPLKLLSFFFFSSEEGFERYKMVVQVVIGEQRGEGVK